MKKLLFVLVVAVTVLSSCNMSSNKNREQQVMDSLRNELGLKEKENDELVEIVALVTEGFREIDEAEGRINIDPETENTLTQKDMIEEQLSFIKNKLAENKEKIEKMETMLKNGSNKNAKLQKTLESFKMQLKQKEDEITELRNELEQKNAQIAELDSKVSEMSGKIENLSSQNENKAKIVDAQDKMINRAWYVFGTKKELRSHKIYDGGEVLKNKDFDKEYFTEVDIREFKELPLYSKRVSLETAHPEGSYELVKDEKEQYILKITNPEEFWNVSRYLVILVK